MDRKAPATKQPRGMKWGYYVFFLLSDANVRNELKLSEDQEAGYDRLGADFLRGLGAVALELERAPAATEKGRAARANAAAQRKAEIVALLSEKALTLLSDQQRQRLSEVIFQLRSVEILYYDDVAEGLALTDQQRADISAIRTWVIDEAGKLRHKYIETERNAKDFEEHADRLLSEAKARALKGLSADQRKRLAAMEGRKIGFSRKDLEFVIRRKESNATPGADPSRLPQGAKGSP